MVHAMNSIISRRSKPRHPRSAVFLSAMVLEVIKIHIPPYMMAVR